jgi:putative heme-binding domain-containing protein
LTRACHKSRSGVSRRNAIWALARLDHGLASAVIREKLNDVDESVIQAAAHAISLKRIKGTAPALKPLLRHPSPAVQRVAAEALGRVGGPEDVESLFQAFGDAHSRVAEHTLTYAILELGQSEATRAGLMSGRPSRVRGAALMALEQMPGGRLESEPVIRAWKDESEDLRLVADWILSRHPEWAEPLAAALRPKLTAFVPGLSSRERDALIGLLAKLAPTPPIQSLLAQAVGTGWRQIAFAAMRRTTITPIPAVWVDEILKLLDDDAPPASALDILGVAKLPPDRTGIVADRLKKLAQSAAVADDRRIQALAALSPTIFHADSALVNWLFERVKNNEPIGLRSPAADTIARGGFSGDQLLRLAEMLPQIGPMELERVLDAFANCRDDRVGERLLTVLGTMKPALRVGTLRPRFAKFGRAIGIQAEKLFAEIDSESAKQVERLERLLGTLTSGDIRRGQTIFNSQKTACSACHAVGYVGGTIGPDLTKIGSIRTERDLLESIVFPSASFVRGYEPVSVMTKRGVPVNGLLKRDTPAEVVITLSATEETRIRRDDIESISPGTVSILPAGLDQQLSEQDLADLIAFLKACR